MLHGDRILVTGVATPDSIAFATARAVLDQGGRLVLGAFPRDLDAARDLAATLDPDIEVLGLDLCDREQVDAAIARIGAAHGELDGLVHAVAFSPRGALGGDLTDTDPADIELAFRTSAWTLSATARMLRELAPATGGSLVGLDFDANEQAWQVYNWMGVCKAALRSATKYLARDFGAERIRVNLVAAGPIETRAGKGIPGFEHLLEVWDSTSPLPWDTRDAAPVADAVCFLLSDLARAITGEVLHVDAGYHAMAAPLTPEQRAARDRGRQDGAKVSRPA
ncbi:MAG: SDR family oxidoreductase [Acidobacteria bacterium]|nr:SDR family oxidoreductase [Acidobacteriota bacterium]